ncbi:MAG: DUF2721 domain-containing protein [Candidatus Hydrogenedentes bacterium]|nr:DUF2721 domain-containing protein [Candidatus Hydrogenedentota bacterium]
MTVDDLIPVLQIAIGPVILISGVGLLLLSMTNRFGRVIDRARVLTDVLRGSPQEHRPRLIPQLRILSRRARLVQLSIIFASLSVLLAAFLIIALFLTALINIDQTLLIVIIFIGCMTSLILSLILFIMDINLSLNALELEMDYTDETVGR